MPACEAEPEYQPADVMVWSAATSLGLHLASCLRETSQALTLPVKSTPSHRQPESMLLPCRWKQK